MGSRTYMIQKKKRQAVISRVNQRTRISLPRGDLRVTNVDGVRGVRKNAYGERTNGNLSGNVHAAG